MKKSDNLLGLATKVLSFGTVYVVLMSYGVNTVYYTGYLKWFGVDINYINFWPSLSDLTIRGIGALGAIALIMVAYIVVLASFNLIATIERKLADIFHWAWLKHASDVFTTSKKVTFVSALGLVIAVSIMVVFHISYNMGFDDAGKQKIFMQAVTDSSGTGKQLLIYQNGGIGVVKRYDTEAETFTSEYSIIDLTNQTFARYELQ